MNVWCCNVPAGNGLNREVVGGYGEKSLGHWL